MPWTLSSLLTMSTTRNGISRNSPPTGQNVPPRRKASMHSRMTSLAPVYSTAASTPSPPVAARIALTASSRPLSTTISAPQRSSLAALPGWRVVAMTEAPASLASAMVAVPMPPAAPVMRTWSFIGRLGGWGMPAGKIAEPANACERERVFGIGHAEHAVARRERRHAGAHRRDFAGDVAAELHRHGEGAAAVDAAVMSGGLAVELVHLAGAVLDVPARDRGGEHLDQNGGRP